MNNDTQCVRLSCLSSKLITYAPSSILSKLSLKKNTNKSRIVTEIFSNIDIA